MNGTVSNDVSLLVEGRVRSPHLLHKRWSSTSRAIKRRSEWARGRSESHACGVACVDKPAARVCGDSAIERGRSTCAGASNRGDAGLDGRQSTRAPGHHWGVGGDRIGIIPFLIRRGAEKHEGGNCEVGNSRAARAG